MTRKLGALILAAGKGTRMKSERAKVIFKLAEKEMVRRVVEFLNGLTGRVAALEF